MGTNGYCRDYGQQTYIQGERERLFHFIIATSRWTCAVVDTSTNDQINILQALLLAMKMASDVLVQLLLLVLAL
jgi:hypothetical protein